MNNKGKFKPNTGITLIALIITIIVMLILVAVVVRTAVESNLFGKAKEAGDSWRIAEESETNIGNGPITINGKTYNSIDEYVAETGEDDGFPKGIDWETIYTYTEEGVITGLKPEYLLDYDPATAEINDTNKLKLASLDLNNFYVATDYSDCWLVSELQGSLIIPNRINGTDITGVDSSTFSCVRNLEKVKISKGITGIGWRAFYGCDSLTIIEIPNSVTRIEDGAFDDCTSLTSIDVPSSVVTMGWSPFAGWTSSQTIRIHFKEDELPSGWDSYWSAYCSAVIVYDE